MRKSMNQWTTSTWQMNILKTIPPNHPWVDALVWLWKSWFGDSASSCKPVAVTWTHKWEMRSGRTVQFIFCVEIVGWLTVWAFPRVVWESNLNHEHKRRATVLKNICSVQTGDLCCTSLSLSSCSSSLSKLLTLRNGQKKILLKKKIFGSLIRSHTSLFKCNQRS